MSKRLIFIYLTALALISFFPVQASVQASETMDESSRPRWAKITGEEQYVYDRMIENFDRLIGHFCLKSSKKHFKQGQESEDIVSSFASFLPARVQENHRRASTPARPPRDPKRVWP